MTKVTPTFDTILTVMTLTSILINRYDLKRAGLPKRYQEHKQTLNIDKGKWKEERKNEWCFYGSGNEVMVLVVR